MHHVDFHLDEIAAEETLPGKLTLLVRTRLVENHGTEGVPWTMQK